MTKDKWQGHFKGGSQWKRDRDFGIKDKRFWKDWERAKRRDGGMNLQCPKQAWQEYDEWKNGQPSEYEDSRWRQCRSHRKKLVRR